MNFKSDARDRFGVLVGGNTGAGDRNELIRCKGSAQGIGPKIWIDSCPCDGGPQGADRAYINSIEGFYAGSHFFQGEHDHESTRTAS